MLAFFYDFSRLMHEGTEKRGFILNRPNGTQDYTLIYFKTPVNIYNKGEIITADPGACIIYKPGALHWFEAEKCDLVHDWLHFTPDNKHAFEAMQLPLNQLFYPQNGYFITQRLRNCEIELINKEMCWHETISSELSLLFIQLSREVMRDQIYSSNESMAEMENRFKQFRVKMYGNAYEDWNIDKMSCELSLCRSRFSVLYHKFFDVSPKKDLIAARVERAKYLLLSVDDKIEQIAVMSGYTNTYHFIRQFKALTGITPGDYRRKESVGRVIRSE